MNAVVLFWVTSGRRDSHSAEAPLPEELPTNPRERRSISLSLRKPPMIHQSSLLPTVPLKLGASSTASQHSSTSPSGCSPEREPHAVANTMMLTPLDEKAIVEEHERTSVEEAPRRGISGFFSSIFPRLGPTEEGSSSQDIQARWLFLGRSFIISTTLASPRSPLRQTTTSMIAYHQPQRAVLVNLLYSKVVFFYYNRIV